MFDLYKQNNEQSVDVGFTRALPVYHNPGIQGVSNFFLYLLLNGEMGLVVNGKVGKGFKKKKRNNTHTKKKNSGR